MAGTPKNTDDTALQPLSNRRNRPKSKRQGPKGKVPVLLALVLSGGLIIAGLTQPALQVSSFAFLSEEVSILDSIRAFRADGQVFLAGLIFIVSAIFPLVKIVLALLLTLSFDAKSRWSHTMASFLSELARWSMTDVFILAVAVMVIDAKLISSANLLPGAYYFASGVILSLFAVHYLRGSLKRHAKRQALENASDA